MAIAIDTSTQSGDNVKTWSHTCSGANRVLVVGITGFPGDTITSVTYNGVVMTLAISQTTGNPEWIYTLIAPSTGANNIIVTSASSKTYSFGVSFTGADQVTGYGATRNEPTTGSSGFSNVITTTRANSIVVDCLSSDDAYTSTIGASQTSLLNALQGGSTRRCGSYETTTTAGNINMSWAGGSGISKQSSALEVMEVAAAPANRGHFSLLGVS